MFLAKSRKGRRNTNEAAEHVLHYRLNPNDKRYTCVEVEGSKYEATAANIRVVELICLIHGKCNQTSTLTNPDMVGQAVPQ